MKNSYTFKKDQTGHSMGHISICPNGFAHLHYGATTIHFPLSDFLALLSTADKIAIDIQKTPQANRQDVEVH